MSNKLRKKPSVMLQIGRPFTGRGGAHEAFCRLPAGVKVKRRRKRETYVLGGVRQLLLDLLHHLPEGRPVERVGIPAGPHDLVPAAEGQQKDISALGQVQGCIFFFLCSTLVFFCFF